MVEKGNNMLRHLLVTTTLALAAQMALAAEAGKVIFVAGKAQVLDRAATEGAAVQEGELLSTGADGFIYIKTIDKGLFILRPNTRARIVAYHVDAKNPANTRIKLELLSGVARSRSGEAVKLARQNFRFNTPVAAIGVRGTDFTVFTDQDTSRVAVISGGVVVSGFAGACRPEGIGPCEGTASRELSASQRGQLLQVQRGQAAPQVMQGGAMSPDQVSPARGDEPMAKAAGSIGTLGGGALDLDPRKVASLQAAVPGVNQPPASAPPDVVGPPPVIVDEPAPPADPVVVIPEPATPVTPVTPPVPVRAVTWGRFQPVLGQAANLDIAQAGESGTRVAINPLFAIYRAKTGSDWVVPVNGSAGFSLKASEAYIVEDYTKKTAVASLENGVLNVDFDKKSFTTSFDLLSQAERFNLQSKGTFASDGRLYGENQLVRPTNMNVNGTLTENGAAYLFDARLDPTRTAVGATSWGR